MNQLKLMNDLFKLKSNILKKKIQTNQFDSIYNFDDQTKKQFNKLSEILKKVNDVQIS